MPIGYPARLPALRTAERPGIPPTRQPDNALPRLHDGGTSLPCPAFDRLPVMAFSRSGIAGQAAAFGRRAESSERGGQGLDGGTIGLVPGPDLGLALAWSAKDSLRVSAAPRPNLCLLNQHGPTPLETPTSAQGGSAVQDRPHSQRQSLPFQRTDSVLSRQSVPASALAAAQLAKGRAVQPGVGHSVLSMHHSHPHDSPLQSHRRPLPACPRDRDPQTDARSDVEVPCGQVAAVRARRTLEPGSSPVRRSITAAAQGHTG